MEESGHTVNMKLLTNIVLPFFFLTKLTCQGYIDNGFDKTFTNLVKLLLFFFIRIICYLGLFDEVQKGNEA